jgi:YidC/Oxa1 family membrane protein insertase
MENKNLILAIVLSGAILLGYEFFIGMPQRDRLAQQRAEQQQAAEISQPGEAQIEAPGTPPQPGMDLEAVLEGEVPSALREAALAEGPRVRISTPTLDGSISLLGGQLDDLVLTQYREAIEEDSDDIVLFEPLGTPRPYYAQFGWSATQGVDTPLPASDTLWTADGDELAPGRPITLSWDNGQGLTFTRTYEVDENYMFTVTQGVRNDSDASVALAPYGLISRSGTPTTLGFWILHEGMIGAFAELDLEEIDYDTLRDDGPVVTESTGGWMGITDKYWMATLVPDQTKPMTARFLHGAVGGTDKYQTDYLYGAVNLAPGAQTAVTSHLFAGAKVVSLLDQYEEELDIRLFVRSVDFGWLYFLTEPIFWALHWIHGIVGNFGVAILVLTVFIKLLFFPLANKSYQSMAKMRMLTPQIKELQEKYGDDRQKISQETMALYKREGANPLAGCLPILIQIPVFFALYKVLFVTIEMRHAPFFGWVQDLSAPDPTTVLNLFGLLPYTVPDLGLLNALNLGIWPLLMGLSMFLQQRLNPQPTDPVQAKIFMFMPIFFTFLLASFPAGLVIYWTWNNTLSIAQQAVIMHRAGVPIGRRAAAAASHVREAHKKAEDKNKKPAAAASNPKPASVADKLKGLRAKSKTRPKPKDKARGRR